MEKLIQDKQAALLHLIQHIGLTQVKRDGSDRNLHDYSHYQVLLNLLMEKGSPAPLREKFARLGWSNKEPRVAARNFLYEYSEVKSAAPVQPGQIISFYDQANEFLLGVATRVNEAGCPTEYVKLEDRNYNLSLKLVKEEIPLDKIFEILDPNTEARQWGEKDSASAFYVSGKQDALRRLIQLQGMHPDIEVKIGGTSYSLNSYKDIHLFRHLAMNCPLEFRTAFFLEDYDRLKNLCSFFGEGIKDYQASTGLAYGTILFLKDEGIGVLLANDVNGLPAIMLSLYQGTFNFCQVNRDMIETYWYPSVEAYKHTGIKSAAYNDLDGFIRKLVMWWHTGEFGNKPLYKSEAFLDKKYLSDSFIDMLKKGPDTRSGWQNYLAAQGAGIQNNAGKVEPGDLVLLATDQGINPAIALHRNQCMYFDYEYSQRLVWDGKTKDVLCIWKANQ